MFHVPCFLITVATLAVIQLGCGRFTIKHDPKTSLFRGVSPIHLTDANFQQEVIDSDIPVVVDMWAPWCQPCIAMKPTIRELAAELSGKVKIAEVNIEENPFIKEKYNVEKYPTLLIFVNGKEAERLVGLKSKEYLNDALQVYTRDQTRAEQ